MSIGLRPPSSPGTTRHFFLEALHCTTISGETFTSPAGMSAIACPNRLSAKSVAAVVIKTPRCGNPQWVIDGGMMPIATKKSKCEHEEKKMEEE